MAPRLLLAALAAWLCAGQVAAAQTVNPTQANRSAWRALYFHDEDDSSLTLRDVAWPGENCILAVGELQQKSGRVLPAVVRSIDGGSKWQISTTSKSFFRSIFFLGERLGWAVTEAGLARTPDCGATWEPLAKERNMLRVHFADEAHGFAVGAPKKVWSSKDGGRSLTEVKPQVDPKADPDRSVYSWVDFLNPKLGIIVGAHMPRRASRRDQPSWVDPETAQRDKQLPSLTLMLQTNDGGATWVGSSASLMGRVTRLRLAPQDRSLLLVEFEDTFAWPSEVYRVSGGTQAMERVFRQKNRAITDMIQSERFVYLAGYEPVGGSIRMPIPGAVKLLRSADMQLWEELPVDYRAVAGRVFLARGPRFRLLAATDTGMILAPSAQ